MTGQKFEAQLMLVADQTTPYRMLTEVIYSCGQAGYANYRLLVLEGQGRLRPFRPPFPLHRRAFGLNSPRDA